MTQLDYKFERTIVICAERTTVFRYFLDSKRFAAWWGEGSTIEGKVGGRIRICYPNAVVALGEVLEFTKDKKIVFTYGYDSGKPIPPGTSKVTFVLQDHPDGTELKLLHEFSDASIRDMHVHGWGYQLAVFANVVCKEQHAGFKQLLSDYYRLWQLTDSKSRLEILEQIATPNVQFRSPYGCATGKEELNSHIESSQKYMPDMNLSQSGEPIECQGNAISNWTSTRSDGTEAGRGTNAFTFAPNGLIQSIVGFWVPMK